MSRGHRRDTPGRNRVVKHGSEAVSFRRIFRAGVRPDDAVAVGRAAPFLPAIRPRRKNPANKPKPGAKPAAGHAGEKPAAVAAKPGDAAAEKGNNPAADKNPWSFAEHPPRLLKLGSVEPNSPYRLDITLTTRGAAILGDRSQFAQLPGPRAARQTAARHPSGCRRRNSRSA